MGYDAAAMRWVRAFLSYIAFWAALPVLIAHPKLRRGYRQRLGLYRGDEIPAGEGPRVWMHGASAGDVLALIPTIRALRTLRADTEIILSTTTNTGRAMANEFRDELASIVYQPYDVPGAVARALNRLEPRVLVLEYTELWPQLIMIASRRGISVVLHNGRLSTERLNRYRWLFRIAGDLLGQLRVLLMRDELGAEAAKALGAPPERVRITGNTKFDNLPTQPSLASLQALRNSLGLTEGEVVWVAGSTHEGEEEVLFEIYARLREACPRLRLVVAPRYIDRTDRLEALCRRQGLRVTRRSVGGGGDGVVLLDTIGELALAYALGDVVFVGGSFIERGGQNILEPAAHGKPVLFGPHMENFADSVTLLLGRGGIQVSNPDQLERVLADLLARPEHRAELGAMARDVVQRQSGAAARNARAIAELL